MTNDGDRPATTRVDLEISDGLAWITLDGPTARNALDLEAGAALIDICARIDADRSVGAAAIIGTGPAFCSGADTAALNRLRTASAAEGYDTLGAIYAAFQRFGTLSVPTVAAVNGPAVGAGLNLALAADLRIMADRAVLLSGFARIGLLPGGGHLHLLARAGGTVAATTLGVFNRTMTASAAQACGLVADVVPVEELRATVTRVTAHLAADPAMARALTADLRRTVLDAADWDRALAVERAAQMWSLTRTRPEPTPES